MSYVDGFAAAVPTDRKADYLDFVTRAAAVFKEHGALEIVECWGDDVPEGELTSFPIAVKRQPGETVVFSWVIWTDRAARDAGMRAVTADPRMRHDEGGIPMPFDGKRMIYGGFEVIARF